MNYRILRTDKANDQLHSLILYIADDSGSIDTALAYLEKLEQGINLLSTSPNMGSYPRYSTLPQTRIPCFDCSKALDLLQG
jgi:toxin ParE1/3/4